MLAAQQQQALHRGGVRLAAAQQPPRPHRLQAAFAAAAAASSRRLRAPLAAAADALVQGDEGDDDVDWTEDMPAPVRRRVRALRGVQERLDDLSRRLARERAALEAKYEKEAAPLLDERAAVVAGEKAVDAYDVPDDEDGGELVVFLVVCVVVVVVWLILWCFWKKKHTQ
jgi:hypothetical protein